IEESFVIEKLMYRVRHRVTHPHYRAEGVRTTAKVSDLPKELHGVTLGLKRELLGVAVAKDLQCLYFHLNRLAFSRRLDQFTRYGNTSPRGQALQQTLIC